MLTLIENEYTNNGYLLEFECDTEADLLDLPNSTKPYNRNNYSVNFDYGVPATGSTVICSANSKSYVYVDDEWSDSTTGGEPASYIKNATLSTDSKILTLTKKDNTQIVFAPGEGKTWTNIELGSADMRRIANGSQIVKTMNAYSPANFKNDYFKIHIDTSGETEGKVLHTGGYYSQIYVDIKDFDSEGNKRDPDWYNADIEKMLNYIVYDGFDYHYYKTAVLYAGCSSEGDPILEGSDLLSTNNVIYVQDVSQQYWEINNGDSEKYVGMKREELQHEVYGSAYVICVNKLNAGTVSRQGFMICYRESQASYLDGTTTKWANILPGKSYPVDFDSTTERWMVRQIVDDTREGHTGEKIAVELTNNEKTTYYVTGWSFTAGLQAAEFIVDKYLGLKAPCVANGAKELIKIFSWNDPFSATTEVIKSEFIGRPAGYYLSSYSWTDDEGTVHNESNGEYVWDIEAGSQSITVVIPATELTTMIIESASSSSVGKVQQEFSTTSLYRHTFTVLSDSTATFSEGEYKLYCSFSGVNAQQGDNTLDYIMWSDVGYSETSAVNNIDWVLPATGKIGVVGASSTVWYDVLRFKAGYVVVSESLTRCLKVEYLDNEGGIHVANVITPDNMSKYIGRDFRSEICDVLSGVSYLG